MTPIVAAISKKNKIAVSKTGLGKDHQQGTQDEHPASPHAISRCRNP
jgi:hypothetical protein